MAANPDLTWAAFDAFKNWLMTRRKAWLRNLWPRMKQRVLIRWMLGVPQAQWTTLQDITNDTTVFDMQRRLYRANYTFTHYHHGRRDFFANPMSLINVYSVGNKVWLVVQFVWDGALRTVHLPSEIIKKIRFHSRLQA